MVHRAPDARLLTNLIANEKEYAKHLASLFPLSHAALASLSAYAAASPAAPARTIAAIVDLLASADDALQRYNHAIDTWREQLLSLKTLEDDLSAVLRDRDILVTRLIKASKATREAHRSSRIMSTLGSASLSSLPSTNSTTTHYAPSSTIPTTVTGTGSSPASTNAKLAQAQAELQACEAHLVAKEHELDARRISVARDGLGARCRALIDCGWVWGEMGKQGLRALQALTADGPPHTAGSKPSYPTYASDNSSLTPSQSASQTAALSAETSHEGATSREHEPATSEPDSHGDLTLTLPPPHAISEFTVPTVRSRSPQNGDAAARALIPNPKPVAIAPVPRRRRTKRVHRPPSQHIAEVSDEGSDTGPFPAPSPTTVPIPPTTVTTANANAADANPGNTDPSTSTPRPFPTCNEDTSSDDEAPFQIVENDPFEVIRRSMLGPSPSVPLLPVPPGTHDGLSGSETSPSRAAFSLGRAAGASVTRTGGKRERRTSMAFFGSLRGLFRKPKERERERVEWDESPKPSSSANGYGRGWVTRTDTRIGQGGEGRGGVDSDSELGVADVKRENSGTRLRKGRPRGTNQGAVGVGVDGWITDSPRPSGVVGTVAGGTSTTGAGLGRARTRREIMKRRKTSVADLRGSEHGHTDGEVEGRTPRPLSKAKVEEAAVKLGRHVSTPVPKGVTGDSVKSRADIDVQHVRAATATATTATRSRKVSETHRRSASVSVVDTHVAVVSTLTSASGTTWHKTSPPASFESSPRPAPRTPSPSRTPSPTSSSTSMPARSSVETKKEQRRTIGNGHAIHGHVQNQSLMSIVADVTYPKDRDDAEREKTRSMDVPRAPGSVLRDEGEVVGAEGSGRGRGRRSSWIVGGGEERVMEQGQGQGHGRGVVKMPLKSALRNASRTPSPSPATVSVRAENGEKKTPASGLGKEDKRAVSPALFRDSMSVSSYATGRESMGEEDEARPEPVLTIPPPPAVDPPLVKEGSTEVPPVRRKSVRVSLQPTFSPTPPAFAEEEQEEYVGRANSEKRRSKQVPDVWADSSSEEEAYQRGRALLNLVGKSDAFKAKALKDKEAKARSARR